MYSVSPQILQLAGSSSDDHLSCRIPQDSSRCMYTQVSSYSIYQFEDLHFQSKHGVQPSDWLDLTQLLLCMAGCKILHICNFHCASCRLLRASWWRDTCRERFVTSSLRPSPLTITLIPNVDPSHTYSWHMFTSQSSLIPRPRGVGKVCGLGMRLILYSWIAFHFGRDLWIVIMVHVHIGYTMVLNLW